jgi:hypothetical protein
MLIRMARRKYTLRKRAAQQDETRQRIVEATMALQGPMQGFVEYLAGYRDALLAAWPRPAAQALPALRATLALAVLFPTWQSLADQGLDDTAMAALAARWAKAAAAEAGR